MIYPAFDYVNRSMSSPEPPIRCHGGGLEALPEEHQFYFWNGDGIAGNGQTPRQGIYSWYYGKMLFGTTWTY